MSLVSNQSMLNWCQMSLRLPRVGPGDPAGDSIYSKDIVFHLKYYLQRGPIQYRLKKVFLKLL